MLLIHFIVTSDTFWLKRKKDKSSTLLIARRRKLIVFFVHTHLYNSVNKEFLVQKHTTFGFKKEQKIFRLLFFFFK